MMNPKLLVVTLAAFSLALSADLHAQQGGRGNPPSTPKVGAPIDLTGYWVSVVTEDWRWRMVTPPKGDYESVPLNAEGKKVADTWDPDKDTASGNQCKSYGAPAIMRVPGRVHVTWENETTLRIDMDSGTQTRLLHFNGVPQGEATLQGYSAAEWELPKGLDKHGGDLKVLTTHLRPGYLRKNGVPYSANATLIEHFHIVTQPDGQQWLLVITLVEDTHYLAMPFITSTHFKKLPDGSGWNPTPCTSK
jgi:hypothetical protein